MPDDGPDDATGIDVKESLWNVHGSEGLFRGCSKYVVTGDRLGEVDDIAERSDSSRGLVEV